MSNAPQNHEQLADEQLTITAPEDSLPPMSLDNLSEPMRQACARASWPRLMPVQAHSLPYLLAGRDMMIQSRTGSGKTGAYLLPLLDRLNPQEKKVQALILVPTRELAGQVEREAQTLFEDTGLGVAAVYGGVGYGKQLEALQRGVQVVVGTPGRVLDHLLRRTMSLDSLRVLVFDEADRMLSIGFYPDMKEIQRYLPRRSGHPLLATLFSATYPPHVLNLSKEFLHDPEMLSLSQDQVHVAATQHLFCECSPMDKDRTLVRLLETENPSSAIIFCNTKSNVHYVTGVLQGFGYNADELSADLSQNKREDVLARLRKGEIRLLVATDVAARGIDIPALSHVILYEPPEDRESYIHRAGRTGRAGAVGTVVSLVDVMQRLEIERIARFYKIDLICFPAPTDEDVAHVVGQRVLALLESRKRACTGLQLERAKRFSRMAAELGCGMADTSEASASPIMADDEQLLLLALLLDAEYQRSLGASVPVPAGRAPTGYTDNRPADRSGSRHSEKSSASRREPREGSNARVSAPQVSSIKMAESVESSAALDADGQVKKRRRRRSAAKKPPEAGGASGNSAEE